MKWRGPVSVVVLLAVGIGAGWAAAYASTDRPAGNGSAVPMEAYNPSLPADPRGTILPDPDYPPLEPGIALVDTTIGGNGFETTFPVPEGWNERPVSSNESKWKKPGAPNNTYILKVAQVRSQRETLAGIVQERAEDLIELQDQTVIVDQRPGYLEYTYVSGERTARRGFIRWLELTGSGFAELEISVTGREEDAAGAADLVDRIAAGARSGP